MTPAPEVIPFAFTDVFRAGTTPPGRLSFKHGLFSVKMRMYPCPYLYAYPTHSYPHVHPSTSYTYPAIPIRAVSAITTA